MLLWVCCQTGGRLRKQQSACNNKAAPGDGVKLFSVTTSLSVLCSFPSSGSISPRAFFFFFFGAMSGVDFCEVLGKRKGGDVTDQSGSYALDQFGVCVWVSSGRS